MSFVLEASPTYRWQVTYYRPTEADGRMEPQRFGVTFARFDIQEVEAVLGDIGADDASALAKMQDACRKILRGWSGLYASKADEKAGKELEFTPANLEAALKVPGVPNSILTAWAESVRGSKAGN